MKFPLDPPVSVAGRDDLPGRDEARFRHLHDYGADPAVEHVDRHDGQHLRARHPAKREGIRETVGQNRHRTGAGRQPKPRKRVPGDVQHQSLGRK